MPQKQDVLPTPADSVTESPPRRIPTMRRTVAGQYANPPPSPPPTNSVAATFTEAEDGDTIVHKTVPAPSHVPPAPPLPPRPPIPSVASADDEDDATQAPMKISSATSPIPIFADSPASSTVSAFLHSQFTHRDLESMGPRDSTSSLPPPGSSHVQLDRRATTGGIGRNGHNALMAIPHPPAPASVSFGEIISRPSSSSPSVSLKEVGKVGTTLGKNPVDYLKPNGSLPQPVSKYFHPTHDPHDLNPPPTGEAEVEGIFGNLNFLLESYLAILSSGGSIAVGTGYRSVARRLLERVEGMFARDLGVPGVGWPEVLEYIRGERSRPPLCTIPVRGLLSRKEEEKSEVSFNEPVDTRELAESVVAGIKQTPAKGKVAEWLEQVTAVLKSEETSAPRDASISRQQEEEEDRIVCEIIEGILLKNTEESQLHLFRDYLESSDLIESTRLALSRLYPESTIENITPPIAALYLLLHEDMHPILSAVANVTPAELDLINSGRFDAFLDGASNVVTKDEEEELQAITALDRRLWTVLENLEDQIEDLHTRALVVRRALKSRKELISKKHKHLAPGSGSPVSRSTSPAKMLAITEREERHEDDEWTRNVPTLNIPITPDDSASNIASNRRRRKERSLLDESGSSGSRREKSKREKSRLKKVDEERGMDGRRLSVRESTLMEGESEAGDTVGSGSRRRKSKREGGERRKDRSRSRSRSHREKRHHHREDGERERERDRERGEKESRKDREEERTKEKGKVRAS